MTMTSLQFKDVLFLLEFMEHANLHHCQVDHAAAVITCEFSEAAIELAVNGYGAKIVNGLKPVV